MTTKGFIVLFLLVVAFCAAAFVGFRVGTVEDFDLVAVSLASFFAAFIIHLFMPGPEIT